MKAALPPGGAGMLNSIYCTPFGSPLRALFYIPPKPTYTAFATSTVSKVNGTGATIKPFDLPISEYVCNRQRTFDIWYISVTMSASAFTNLLTFKI